MGDGFAIFPASGLERSILLPIYFGLLVHVMAVEALGWSISGLVVAGYLASIFAVSVPSGTLICLETLATFALVGGIDRLFTLFRWAHGIFGRDRFVFFFIASLFVRVVLELWLLPVAADWIDANLGVKLELASHLFGIGLVIVPLAAHALWRPSFWPGLVQVTAVTGITYLFLAFVLIPWTNFSVAGFELIHRELALDLSSSPKLYITLIVGMTLAASFNLKFGWDFNGVMVPALLSVAWYTPLKVVSTLGEATVVFLVTLGLMSLPGLRRATLTGHRALLAIVGVSFAVKFGVGWLLAETAPGFNATDLYGFGYLLPALIAMSLWNKRHWATVVFPPLATSLLAFLGGNVVGLGLHQVDELIAAHRATVIAEGSTRLDVASVPPATLRMAGALTRAVLPEDLSPVSSPARAQFREALIEVEATLAGTPGAGVPDMLPPGLARGLEALNLRVVRTRLPGSPEAGAGPPVLVLREPLTTPPGGLHGWGTIVWMPGCSGGIVLEVPYPAEEPEAMEAALHLMAPLNACRLIAGGWRAARSDDRGVLDRRDSPFLEAHRNLAAGPVLQVRTGAGLTTLYVDGRVPASLPLSTLKSLVPGFRMAFEPFDVNNPARTQRLGDFLELVVEPAAAWAMEGEPPDVPASTPMVGPATGPAAPSGLSGSATIRALLASRTDLVAPALSEAYRVPTWVEMRYWGDQVVRPLRAQLAAGTVDGPHGPAFLRALRNRAQAVDYDVTAFPADGGEQVEVLLAEPTPLRHWGILLFRSGAPGIAVEVPRPRWEAGVLPIALDLYGRMQGTALLIAGADLDARADGLADVTRLDNPVNPFQAAHEALYPREPGGETPRVVQVRGMGASHVLRGKVDAVLSPTLEGAASAAEAPSLVGRVEEDLSGLGWTHTRYDASLDQLGLKGSDNLQVRYSRAVAPESAVVLWVSEYRRNLTVPLASLERVLGYLGVIGLAPQPFALDAYLRPGPAGRTTDADVERVARWLEQFVLTRNAGYVRAAAAEAARGDVSIAMRLDRESGKTFLVVSDPMDETRCAVRTDGAGAAGASLAAVDDDRLRLLRYGTTLRACVAR